MSKKLIYCDLGTLQYKESWDLQKSLLDLRYRKRIDDVLLLVEHPHTYTLGKTANHENLVGNSEYLEKNRISVFDIDRGGDITYHGPGQIVGYPIFNLINWKKDTHKYLRALEELLIRTCRDYGVDANRNSALTGVWIDERKIAAIGIKVSRWITMHGFAFNVNTDLNLFDGIIPCGLNSKEVTSLSKEINRVVELESVKSTILKYVVEIFEYDEVEKWDAEKIVEWNLIPL